MNENIWAFNIATQNYAKPLVESLRQKIQVKLSTVQLRQLVEQSLQQLQATSKITDKLNTQQLDPDLKEVVKNFLKNPKDLRLDLQEYEPTIESRVQRIAERLSFLFVKPTIDSVISQLEGLGKKEANQLDTQIKQYLAAFSTVSDKLLTLRGREIVQNAIFPLQKELANRLKPIIEEVWKDQIVEWLVEEKKQSEREGSWCAIQ